MNVDRDWHMYRMITLVRRFAGRHVRKCLLLIVRVRLFFVQRRISSVKNSPLKVAFLVVFDSVFPFENVFRLMLKDVGFLPEIIVIPDISRGKDNQEMVMRNTYEQLARKYGGHVKLSAVDGRFVDISGAYDLYTTMNPYSDMTHIFYSIPYLAKKGCLVFASRYFTDTGTVYSNTFNSLSSLAWLWRFYAEDHRDQVNIIKAQPFLRRGGSVVAVGRPKMDSYKREEKKKSRKCIIIAPHHSIDSIGANKFSIGNFHRFADFFLSLPQRYPNIDWVFRPHPLTLRSMVLSGRWKQKECDEYVEKMCAYSNVIYEAGGEYLKTFAESDGMIQDCSSFLPEYFYTGMPQCYLLKNKEAEDEQFLQYGKQLLSYVYKAYSEDDILSFINDVILAGNDSGRENRLAFAETNLMYNYPHASEAIVEDLKIAVGRKPKPYS